MNIGIVSTIAALLLGFPPAAAPSAAPCSNPVQWDRLILANVARYPAMELPDLYKLLHQATMGSEHAAVDTVMARDWLKRELATLAPGPPEALVDSLGTSPRFVRVNLRPYRAAHHDPEALLNAFVATAHVAPPDPEALTCAVSSALALARNRKLPWPSADVAKYLDARAASHWAAVDHSEKFVAAYHPAYRVVAISLLGSLLKR